MHLHPLCSLGPRKPLYKQYSDPPLRSLQTRTSAKLSRGQLRWGPRLQHRSSVSIIGWVPAAGEMAHPPRVNPLRSFCLRAGAPATPAPAGPRKAHMSNLPMEANAFASSGPAALGACLPGSPSSKNHAAAGCAGMAKEEGSFSIAYKTCADAGVVLAASSSIAMVGVRVCMYACVHLHMCVCSKVCLYVYVHACLSGCRRMQPCIPMFSDAAVCTLMCILCCALTSLGYFCF